MLYSQKRHTLRNIFIESWKKHQQKLVLSPLEKEIVAVLFMHPEYQVMLGNADHVLNKDYYPDLGEENPFLHLSLHLSILDQVRTNRPDGITEIYAHLVKKYQDEHTAQHHMMTILQDILWLAQKNNQAPDERAYSMALSSLIA